MPSFAGARLTSCLPSTPATTGAWTMVKVSSRTPPSKSKSAVCSLIKSVRPSSAKLYPMTEESLHRPIRKAVFCDKFWDVDLLMVLVDSIEEYIVWFQPRTRTLNMRAMGGMTPHISITIFGIHTRSPSVSANSRPQGIISKPYQPRRESE